MRSRWSGADAERIVAHYAERGVATDLALRVYTSRLLGKEPELVQHGGGNTSLKTTMRDVLGAEVPVLCVKGSGWDLGNIEPAGLPAVRMAPLIALRAGRSLTDEAMVNAQRAALLDAGAPNPSVETLLHAWIAPKYIEHTHANAVLALCDQPHGEALCKDLYGQRVAVLPYCMPGFALAQLAAAAFEAAPRAEGMVLLKHGIVSWGDEAQQAYERMIALVDLAETELARRGRRVFVARTWPPAPALAELAPRLRGSLAEDLGGGRRRRWILEYRTSSAIREFAAGRDVERYSQQGPVTPDHVIRIKPWPLIVSASDRISLRAAVDAYAVRYREYFARHNERAEPPKKLLDQGPRVVLVPGLGLFGVGASRADAATAADIAETNIAVITAAESMDRYESISEADLFAMEYWSLEQAKLGNKKPKRLAGQIVAVTGGGGTIGAAVARAFAAEGAAVAVLDFDVAKAGDAARACGGIAIECDVTDGASVAAAFDAIVARHGGLDVLVSNAGAAWTGRIGEVADSELRASFELNFFAHQRAAQAAVAIMLAQGTGGCLLFNASKQAVNPGPDFGPYGVPKAATLALSRQYALDYGAAGIRSNALNADRIRSGLLTDDMIKARAAARHVTEHEYMAGNLLGCEVSADDVAQAFLSLALAEKTTAAVLTVDGGNIAAALR
jgi:rhamnose utilization protein RhaD (predicted bifunctional aldolase and dehydrogenase)/NAD(P)-dependent dehydrogenase (short-subunit alcohol dehydrogenase family)